MSIEVATFINDLQSTNPPATDPRSQGDDHLRLIKQVLQNTFPNATRAFNMPTTTTLSGGTAFSVLKANTGVVYVSTATGAVTLTLPSLAAVDAGWSCEIVKITGDTNPIFVTPPAGTINSGGIAGLAHARRCIPGVPCRAVWDGSNWFVTRCLALPIGCIVPFYGAVLPAGYEWPAGAVLSSVANYPEYNNKMGGLATPDVRGCALAALDNLGGTAAGRLPSGYIAQTTLGAGGGADGVATTLAQTAFHRHTAGIYDVGHLHGYTGPSGVNTTTGGGGFVVYSGGAAPTGQNTSSVGTGVRVNSDGGLDTTYGAGSGTAHMNLQPTIMCGMILVVE